MVHPHCGMRWSDVLKMLIQDGILYEVVVTAPPRAPHVISDNSRVLRVDNLVNRQVYILSE